MLLAAITSANAQTTFLNEDFEGGTLPSGWTQVTSATDGGWKFGINTALQSSNWPIPAHTKFAATNDDGCNCDKSNDLIKTTSVNLSTAASARLSVDVLFYEGTYNNVTEVGTIEVSTDGGTTWTVLETLTGQGDWYTDLVDLSAYAGNSNVMIGFRYNDGGDWLYGYAIDNVKIYEPAAWDASALSINMFNYVSQASPVTIAGQLQNLGANTITSMTLNYSVDNGAPVSQSVSSISIAPTATYNYSHSTAWNPASVSVGTHTIKVWASSLNGNADMVMSNDTATHTVYVAQSLSQRMVLMEEFSSSTCAPCAAANPTFNALLGANGVNTTSGKVAAVKYQMNYPSPGNDPAYTAEATTRHNYYGVQGIPNAVMDGKAYNGHPANLDQQMIDDEYAVPAVFDITIAPVYSGNTVTITGNVTSHVAINGNLKIMAAVIERQIQSTDNGHGVQSNGETEWYEVMRKMVPGTNGTTLGNQTANQSTPINLSYTFGTTPTVFSGMNNLTAVVWVQDLTTQEVFQATVADITTGINDPSSLVSSYSIYPNPFSNNATIAYDLKEAGNVKVNMYNVLGELVYSADNGVMGQGMHSMNIDATEMPAGIYYVNLVVGNSLITQKVNIVK